MKIRIQLQKKSPTNLLTIAEQYHVILWHKLQNFTSISRKYPVQVLVMLSEAAALHFFKRWQSGTLALLGFTFCLFLKIGLELDSGFRPFW